MDKSESKKLQVAQTSGGPTILEVYFQVNIREKSLVLPTKRGKIDHFEIYQSTLFFFNQAWPQGKLVHQNLTSWGNIRA